MTQKTKRKKRSEVQVKETWCLKDLFKTYEDWQEELDVIQIDVRDVTSLKGKLTSSSSYLLRGLQAYEKIQERLIRLATYAHLLLQTDGSHPDYQSDFTRLNAVLTKIETKLSFVQSELRTLSKSQIETFFKEQADLHKYKKMLNDVLEKKPYTLDANIEEVLAALGDVHRAPYMIYERSKSSDFVFDSIQSEDETTLPMSFALYEDRYELSPHTDIRRKAYDSFIKTLNRYKHTYAALYGTEVTRQVALSRLRSYDSVTQMLLESQQVTEKMYANQLDIIQTELAPHMQRYAQLKKDQLHLDEMRFCDLQAPLDPTFNPETTYEEATSMIIEALKVMGKEYSEIIEKAINNRWIDYSDNIGKATGAFCSSPYGVHPYILITWTNTMRGAFVLAHELGHAGHFYLAGKYQNLLNTRPSTYFVEAPSTMNELLLANYLFSKADDKRMKRWVIEQLLGTYYHNFVTHLLEGEFQRRVYRHAEKGTPLTAQLLSTEKREVLERFWGDAIVFDDGAGLTWMRQPHYYMGLYPYTYSAGLTISTVVMQQIKAGEKKAVDRWLEVLKAGGTMKPIDLIQKVGIDMSKQDAICEAVRYVGSLIDELEKSYE